MFVIVYKPEDGRIVGVRHGSVIDMDLTQQFSDLVVSEAVDARTHYVPAGVVTPRPDSPCTQDRQSINADGIDEAITSLIPAGAACRVSDVNGTHEYVINDGLLIITADAPGQIRVRISAWPYRDYETTVTAQ